MFLFAAVGFVAAAVGVGDVPAVIVLKTQMKDNQKNVVAGLLMHCLLYVLSL